MWILFDDFAIREDDILYFQLAECRVLLVPRDGWAAGSLHVATFDTPEEAKAELARIITTLPAPIPAEPAVAVTVTEPSPVIGPKGNALLDSLDLNAYLDDVAVASVLQAPVGYLDRNALLHSLITHGYVTRDTDGRYLRGPTPR